MDWDEIFEFAIMYQYAYSTEERFSRNSEAFLISVVENEQMTI